jgi:hypothetical protein
MVSLWMECLANKRRIKIENKIISCLSTLTTLTMIFHNRPLKQENSMQSVSAVMISQGIASFNCLRHLQKGWLHINQPKNSPNFHRLKTMNKISLAQPQLKPRRFPLVVRPKIKLKSLTQGILLFLRFLKKAREVAACINKSQPPTIRMAILLRRCSTSSL